MAHAGTVAEAPPASSHRCSHCSREFVRAEHLARHERTHTKEKPYVCDRCPEAFSRRDLLKRHEVKAHDYTKGLRQRRQSRVPSDSSSKSRKKAAEESAAAGTDTSPVDSSLGQSEMDLDVTSFTQWLDAGPGWDFQIGGESEGWVVNQLQNQAQAVGISNMGFTDQLPLFDPAALSIFPPHNAASFTTSNKPVPSDPPLSLDSENDTVSSPLPAATGRLFITEHHRNLIRGLLLGSTLRDNWKLPPLVKLNQYVTRFMACFHRHQPLFHEPSWVPSESPAAVVLAVCANGAQYCLEGQDARRLFQAAVLLATECVEEVSGVSSLQLDMLIVAFAAWSGQTQDLSVAMQFHGKMALDVRQVWNGVAALPESVTWEQWREREILKRATYCCFTVLNLMAIAYDIPSNLRLEDIHGLPAHEELWRAPDDSTWKKEMASAAPAEWQSVEAVIQRLAMDTLPPPTRIGPFACHVVISSLCQSFMFLHKAYHGDAEAFNHARQRLSQSLYRWQIMWESEPSSGQGTSPDNPSGPMPFNSTAMLRVAHIRLAADHAPLRSAFTIHGLSEERIAATIASALRPLSRDTYSCRAALQSCLALRVPVQLGFSVIARTGFWAWSVQHALSYFECAVFLGRWLLSIQMVDVIDLTPEEKGILSLVEQIIEASPFTLEGQEENSKFSHARAILRLFARLLDTGDVTVWGLSPKMSRVLEGWLVQMPT